MTPQIDILTALDTPGLFKGMFDGPTWRPWRAFLAALFALPMDDEALALYRHHTGRMTPPTVPFRSATLKCGRRGGKSRILGLTATFLACIPDHRPYLVPGETPVVAVLAKDRDQARVIFSYILGTMRAVPALAAMVAEALAESVTLTNGVTIEVHTASIAAPRGRTFLAVLCDETAFWPTGDSANPDVEVINAVRPGLTTIPYSLLLVASSPYAKRGILYQNYARYFGKDDAPVLVWEGATEEMNPSLVGDPLIAEMYLEDPERASAEFGAQFRSDIVAFITREAVQACVPGGVLELPPGGGITYVGFVDPSGGSADSFTLAIGHMGQDGTAILDAIREVKPPFSPDAVVQEFAEVLKSYRITRVTGDAYAGEWPRERFAVHGIQYEVSKKSKGSLYAEFLPALNGRRVQLLDTPRLIGQFCGLDRRTARGGRDSIDHGPGQHDDVANVVAGVLVTVINDRVPSLVRPADVMVADHPVPDPTRLAWVVAVLAVDQRGNAAVAYFGRFHDQAPVLIVDVHVGFMNGRLFGDIHSRILGLLERCHAPMGSAWTPQELVPHAVAAGLPAYAIPVHLTEPSGLILSAARHIAAGSVKLCVTAAEKADASTLRAAFDLRAADGAPDVLRTAIAHGIALCLDAAP